MRPPVGTTSSEGKKPTTPTIGTASAGNAQATVPFTASTYQGKTNSGTYRATSTPGSVTGTCTAPCSSITVTGLSNGTAYTFTVQLETPYGVNSDLSASSNSVTPVAPPPSFAAPPSFPSFTAPSFPSFTSPSFPSFTSPSFPSFTAPSFPQFTNCGSCGDGGCESYISSGSLCGCFGPNAVGYRCRDGCGNICSDDPCLFGCL